jgi:polar amino acid transport system substrate-binding protein
MRELILSLACLIPFAAVAEDVSPATALAPSGTLRAAINLGNSVLAQRDPAGGAPRGVSADLARELAARLGVKLDYVTYDGAGLVSGAARSGAWDVCFLAVDPKRAEDITFTAPYVLIEGAYLVADQSPLQSVAEVDREGVRVMADRGSAYDLFLKRSLKRATLVYPPEGRRAGAYWLTNPADVLAGVKQPLVALAAAHPGYRVLPGRFMKIQQAMGTVHPAGAAYLRAFVEEMKASGFVARSLAASGQAEAEVAPAAR